MWADIGDACNFWYGNVLFKMLQGIGINGIYFFGRSGLRLIGISCRGNIAQVFALRYPAEQLQQQNNPFRFAGIQ